ncbi:MAG: VanZ family protein [Erysipelotrichaceae bacterium]
MVEALKWFINIVNSIHHWILSLNDNYSWALSDKDLHFIIFGLLSLAFFIGTNFMFKRLAKISLNLVSFIYTFTVMFALALAIEFGQRYTNQGIMDFDDVLYGIYGFIAFFIIYQVGLKIVQLIRPSNKKGGKK